MAPSRLNHKLRMTNQMDEDVLDDRGDDGRIVSETIFKHYVIKTYGEVDV
jgi:hypothetical protein